MIHNEPTKRSEELDYLRGMIEHRATWFYYLVKAAMDEGLDYSFARKAIFNCGCFHGNTKYPRSNDMHTFTKAFTHPNLVDIFEMEVQTDSDEEMRIDFHYCPLVAAWRKLTDDEEMIATLCDIAMDGDRGIVSTFDGFSFTLGDTIAKGDDVCQVCVRKACTEAQT